MTKQLQEVQVKVERDELAVAEGMLNRLAEQAEQARVDSGAAAAASAKVAGQAVLFIPHRSDAADEDALPGEYRKILTIVRETDGPVQVRAVGEQLGLDASVHVGPRAGLTRLTPAEAGGLVSFRASYPRQAPASASSSSPV